MAKESGKPQGQVQFKEDRIGVQPSAQERIIESVNKIAEFISTNLTTIIISFVIMALVITISLVIYYYYEDKNEEVRNQLMESFLSIEEMEKAQQDSHVIKTDTQRINESMKYIQAVVDKGQENKVDIPEFWTAKYLMGVLNWNIKNFEGAQDTKGAIEFFTEVAQQKEFYLSDLSQLNIGLCYEQIAQKENNQDKYLLAIKAYEELKSRFPNSPYIPEANYHLALCYQIIGGASNLAKAREVLSTLADIPEYRDIQINLENLITIEEMKLGVYVKPKQDIADSEKPLDIQMENASTEIHQESGAEPVKTETDATTNTGEEASETKPE